MLLILLPAHKPSVFTFGGQLQMMLQASTCKLANGHRYSVLLGPYLAPLDPWGNSVLNF